MGEYFAEASTLADSVYRAQSDGGRQQLSVEANMLMDDFRIGSPLRKEFDQVLYDNNLLRPLILMESDVIDGAGENNPKDGVISATEVNGLLDAGVTDLYLKTALEYLKPVVDAMPAGEGVRVTTLLNDSLNNPATKPDPDAQPLTEGTSGMPDLYAFNTPTDWTDGSQPDAADGTTVTDLVEPGDVLPGNYYVHENGMIENMNPMASETDPTAGNTAAEQRIEAAIQEDYTAVLNDPARSTVEQLSAIKKLVENGTSTAMLTDADGNQINVRMEVVPIEGSSRSMVHMFAIDPATGKETVVLRAINDGDNWLHQRDKHGNEVDFVGTRWKRDHAGTIFGD